MLGDSHTTELAYVFGHDGNGKRLEGQDRALSRAVISYWTSLALTGDPNLFVPDLLDRDDLPPPWPAFNPAHQVQSLATPIVPAADFATRHQCAFWASLGYPEVLIESVPAAP